MLTQLYIKNFAIIEELHLEMSSGMTVVTGATGAGKSIMIDALELILGTRADSKTIRANASQCEISAVFDVSRIHAASLWLTNQSFDHNDECIIRRVINRDGRSRNFINGQPVALLQLKELANFLINIHGQHEHQNLLKRDAQRQLLDQFANHAPLLKEIQSVYTQWHEHSNALAQLNASQKEKASRLEFLTFQIKELDELNLSEDEYETISKEHHQLANRDELVASLQSLLDITHDNEEFNVLTALNAILQQLNTVEISNQHIQSSKECFNNAMIQVNEAHHELLTFYEALEADPDRLSWLEARLTNIHDLARKHHVEPRELVEHHRTLKNELSQLENHDENIEALQQRIEACVQAYQQIAKKLSANRKKAAKTLSKQISQHMQQLGMPGGQFEIKFEAIEKSQLTTFGAERVEFYVITNPGQPALPLNKVVSGGELSRISLAIQLITAQQHITPTLIFDEVDVGIGGGTAEIVGNMLAALSENTQVLCITHLPQVASHGQHHLLVHKQTTDHTTSTTIKFLDYEERINEIARMLGGIKITDNTLAHAKEMLCNEA